MKTSNNITSAIGETVGTIIGVLLLTLLLAIAGMLTAKGIILFYEFLF